MTGKIDISPEQLAIVQGTLRDHLPKGTLAWAFGSRVTWTAKPFSDLDIALEGAAPLDPDVLIDLEEAFETSDLPWKVDVIDLNAVTPEFRAIVERQRVPADWCDLQLHEVGKIVTGKTPPTSNPDFYDGYIPFVTPSDMDGKRRIETTARNLTADGAKKVGSSYVDRPAISVSCIGSDMGKAALVDPPFVTNQQINSIIVSDDFERLFVYYNLSARKEEIRNRAGGAAQPIMNKSDFGKLSIFAPCKPEQTRISNILGTLDDKIELNRRMNETLEAMARAVFRDWFVDFGPTRRKAAGKTDPAAILGSLIPDPENAASLALLFPDTFGDNGLPEGWQEKPLDEIAEFLNGLALQKFPAKTGEDSLPVIKIAELRGGVTAKSNRASRDLPQKYVINDGDFIFSWSGSLMAKFWTEGEGALNQHLFRVSSETYPAWFYSQWVYHNLDEFQRIAASKATTMGHIQRGHLKTAMTVDPGEAMLNAMSGIMGPLLELAIHNDLENQTLADTRDLLLPKLMSGEIRLTDMEGAV